MSVWTGKNSLFSFFHPQCVGFSVFIGCFQHDTWKSTQKLWNLAAAEVGGNEEGSTCVKCVATLLRNL